MKHALWLLLPLGLFAQEPPKDRVKELEQAVATVNAVFEQAWPGVLQMMEQQMTRSFRDMDDGEMVRKLRVAELKLSEPPKMTLSPCPGDADCRRLRFSAPGKGKWSIKVAGEIVPPWQRNRTRWRKLRLTLKDLSLTQDYHVVAEADGGLRLEPAGTPEMTFRLTSPNLLYRAVLAAAQRFIGDSVKETLAEDVLSELPIAELALVNLGGLDMQNAVADLSQRLTQEPEAVFEDAAIADAGRSNDVRWVPLDIPPSERAPLPDQSVEDDAFEVAFVDKDLDFYAPSFTAEATVKIPPGAAIEDVVFRLGDREIARLTKPPWRVRVTPGDDAQVLFAAATLTDGVQEDDYLYIEGRGHIEEMEVTYVKVPVRFPPDSFTEDELADMRPADFTVREDGVPQNIENLSLALNRRLELVLAVDMSASMNGQKLEKARAAATQFVAKIFRPGDRVRVLAYNDKVKLSPAYGDVEQIRRAIMGLNRPKGGSRTLDALDRALDAMKDDAALRVVLLVTDGWNASGKISLKALKQRLHQEDALVYTVGINVRRHHYAGYGKNFTPLERPRLVHLQDLYDLAVITGGRPFFVDKTAWLRRAFSELEEELRSQLTIGYVSNQPGSRKGWREIKVDYLPGTTPLTHKARYWKE